MRTGATSRRPDVVDRHRRRRPGCALRSGELSGIEAFSQRRLYARGDLDLAIGFEGLFRLPDGRPPLLRIHDVHLPAAPHLDADDGRGPDVLLLHGLGGTKSLVLRHRRRAQPRATASTRSTCPASARSSQARHRALQRRAGSPTPCSASMDALGIERAHLVGNSMGGRVAIEVGPARARARRRASALLCPAVAFVKRGFHPLVRARCAPSSACCPTASRRAIGRAAVLEPVRRPRPVDPSVADVVVDEFQRIYGSAGARYAFLSARAQHLPRRARSAATASTRAWPSSSRPALFVWGSHDKLIPAGFAPPRRAMAARRPSRSSSTAAATCPRSSAPSRPTACCERFFARVDAARRRARRSARATAAAA